MSYYINGRPDETTQISDAGVYLEAVVWVCLWVCWLVYGCVGVVVGMCVVDWGGMGGIYY